MPRENTPGKKLVARTITAIDPQTRVITVDSAFTGDFASLDAPWFIAPPESSFEARYKIDIVDPDEQSGFDGKASISELLSLTELAGLIDVKLSATTDINLEITTQRFANVLSAPQLRTDLSIFWQFVDRELILADGTDLEEQVAGLGPRAFGDSFGFNPFILNNVEDDNQYNVLSTMKVTYGGAANSFVDGDIIRIEGARGSAPTSPAPIRIKVNDVFIISNEAGNTFTLDDTMGEDASKSGTPGFRNSRYTADSGEVFILPKISTITVNQYSGIVTFAVQSDDPQNLGDGVQIALWDAWAAGSNGTFVIANFLDFGSSYSFALADFDGNILTPAVLGFDPRAGQMLAETEFGDAYIDNANAPIVRQQNVQMNMESVVGDFVAGVIGSFKDAVGPFDWLLSPSKGFLFKNDPIFSFLNGRDFRVIDTFEQLFNLFLKKRQKHKEADNGAISDKKHSNAGARRAGSAFAVFETIDGLSTIYGLAERLSAVQNALDDDPWVNLGTMVLPDIRGVGDLSALFDPQTTPKPGGISAGLGAGNPDFLEKKGGSTDPNDKNKKKTTKRGGQIGIVNPSISFSKQVSNKVMKTDAKGKEYVAKEITKKAGVGASGGLILDFPILTKPEQAMRLLVGADVDLFTLILPTLTISFDFNKSQTIMAGPVPIAFGIGFSIDISVALAFGMDTAGYRDFARTDDKDDISNGFFFLDVREFQEIQNTGVEASTYTAEKSGLSLSDPAELSVGFRVSFSIGLGLGKLVVVGLRAGIEGSIDFNLHDPDLDGRVRLAEIEASTILANGETNVMAMFDISGTLSWFFEFFVEVFSSEVFSIDPFEKAGIDQTIVSGPLATFDRPAIMAVAFGDEIRLNMGAFAEQRYNVNTDDGAEWFTLTLAGDYVIVSGTVDGTNMTPNQLNDPGVENVTKFDLRGMRRIVAYGGAGNDKVVLSGWANYDYDANPLELVFRGGAGNDIVFGNGAAIAMRLYGEEGDDNLTGGSLGDIIEGGVGDDALIGGGGNDSIDGGKGDDTLIGNSGDDTLTGGYGDDTLTGGAGSDTYLFGQLWGTDTIVEEASEAGAVDTMDFSRARARINMTINSTTVASDAGLTATDDFGLSASTTSNIVTQADNAIERIVGGRGADRFFIGAMSADGLEIDGRDGNDAYLVQMGPDLKGLLLLEDTGFSFYTDTLTVLGTSGDDAVSITNQQILLGAPAQAVIVYEDAGLERLIFNMRNGSDTVWLHSAMNTASVEINGEGGNDDIILGSAQQVTTATALADLANAGAPGAPSTLAGIFSDDASFDFEVVLPPGDGVETPRQST